MTKHRLSIIKDLIKIIIAFATLGLNFILVFALLYDPLSQFLIDKNQPYKIPSSTIITAITFTIIALVIVTSIISIFKIIKRQKIFIYSPIFSLTVLITIIAASYLSLDYPSSTTEYSKDGYYYKMEIWWNLPNNRRIYKRWRSVQPYDGKSNTDDLEYKLDSLSNSIDE